MWDYLAFATIFAALPSVLNFFFDLLHLLMHLCLFLSLVDNGSLLNCISFFSAPIALITKACRSPPSLGTKDN